MLNFLDDQHLILCQYAQEHCLAYFLRECLPVGPRHATWGEHISSAESKPGQGWPEDITTVILLLHKAHLLERHQQSMHGALWQAKRPRHIGYAPSFRTVFER
jgi:hypothetical protein